LETAVQQTTEAIVITDAQLEQPGPQIVYVNPAYTRMTGYTAEEVIGKTPRILQGPKTERAVLDRLRQALSSGQEFLGEAINYRKDGSEFVTEWHIMPIRNEQGETTHYVGVKRDVTARHQVQAQLLYQADLLQNVSDAIISTDMNFVIKSWNRAAEVIYGWRAEEVIGKPSVEVLKPHYGDDTRNQMIRDFQNNGYWKGEMIHTHRNSNPLYILGSVAMLRDSTGNPIGAVAVNRDITKDKQIEEELLKAELLKIEVEKERELIELKENFLSMVSHDFRTPLTVIVTSTDLLENFFDHLTPEKRLQHLSKIRSQTGYMRKLLDDVLLFSKGQAGKIEFKPAPLDLNAFCREVVEQLQLADKDRHEFVVNLEGDFNGTHMDDKLLQHILVNLLSNAAKYSPAGSHVWFDVARNGTHAIFTVRDEGIGIPQEDQPRLFQPFQRAGNVGDVHGTGLGLAIVKNNVDTHGGTIAFESRPGAGTTFTVKLPLTSA
jgi:PAS domain S-box-containing protein